MKHVLYIRNDGALVAELERRAGPLRERTREKISTASLARRLLWAALGDQRICRGLGLGPGAGGK